MAANWPILTFTLLSVFSVHFRCISSLGSCSYKVGSRQFTITDWVWSASDGRDLYNISFCSQKSTCNGANICKISKEGNEIVLGKRDASTQFALASDKSGFTAIFQNGAKCSTDGTKNYTSEVYFSCGKTIGNLEFVEENGCTFIFEFTTTEACQSAKELNEIPCTILDRNKKIRDLTQLVKVKGGHRVASSDIPDFYINVCREITGEVAPGKHCPQGSSSCANGIGKGHIVDFSNLEIVNDYTLNLRYANTTSGCSTNVTFVCPKAVSQIGGRGPVLQSSSSCHYEVLWETEHACPVDDQVSSRCTITTKDGLFDLSPLKRDPNNFYKVNYVDSKSKAHYIYFLNICGDMKDFPCGSNTNETAVCQTKQGSDAAKNAGDSKHMKLRYVDGQLMLVYKHGAVCSSGIRRSTIIKFYCNESANIGTPTFNYEDYCNYFFDWPTRLVCPRARKTGNECRVVTPTNTIYDLTELIKIDSSNWHVSDATSSGINGIYMNVCGSLKRNSNTNNCPADNAICIASGSSSIGLGKFESKLTSDATNSLRLIYTNGSACGAKKRRKSVVTFICHPGQLSNAPMLISKSPDGCDYEFVWQTAAACPLTKRKGENCQLSDPANGYSFDLTPLSKARPVAGKDYFKHLDSAKEYEYQIKICEGSSQTSCSKDGKLVGACQYKAGTKTAKIMGEANSNLVYFDGLLKLTYLHGDKCHDGQYRETHIAFICDEKAGIGNPQFEKEVACGTYNFLWYTKYACLSKIVECVAFDAKTNRHYDLSSLSSQHHWQAINGDRKYFINVCRPLYKRPNGCSVSSAICDVRVDSKGVETFMQDLGSVSQSPTIESNGDLVIVYENGGFCGKNKKITSTIRFICKSSGGAGSPEFDKTTSDACNFIFTWETSYACPVGDSKGGSKGGNKGTCMVQDPISQYIFNLSPLRRSNGFYHVKSGADTYVLNICGNVTGSGCNDLGPGYAAAACKLTGKSKQNPVIGSVSQELTYNLGQITLKYNDGERQGDGYEYKTVITFLCNKNIVLGTPSFDQQAKHIFYFKFETSLACTPEPVQCRIAGPGNVMYNLEPLIKKKGYWTALNRETSGQKHHYFINVCQALIEGPPACPKNAIAACQVDYNAKTQKGHSIGYITSNPQVNDKTLSIHYRNGEYCHHAKQNRSVQIFFHCSSEEGSPVFQTETKECRYIFNWLTPAACPVSNSKHENCKIEHPAYNHVFDLSKMSNGEVSVNSAKFLISTCGKTKCGDYGACVKSGTKSKNIGNVNSMVQLVDGDIFIEYSNDNVKTRVRFVCDKTEDLSFITNPNGKDLMQLQRYDFEWKTPVACLPNYKVECSLFLNGKNEDEMYDFSVLSKWNDNWRAHIDTDRVGYPVNRKVFINVCRNIVKVNSAEGCHHESGICMIRGSTRLNLGSMSRSPYKEGDEIVLEYSNGDICKGDVRYSAKVTVKSKGNEVGLGEPVLVGVEGCMHIFTWTTSAARPINKNKQPSGTDCKVVNPLTGNVIDLTAFKDNTEEKVKDGRGGYYMIRICSPFKDATLRKVCGVNSGVCRLSESDSKYKLNSGNYNEKVIFDKVLTLKYTDGDICPKCNCPRETIITFVCAPEEGDGHPVLKSQIEDCTQVFVWRTNRVCEKEVQCTAFGNLKAFNIGNLAKANGNIQVSTTSSDTVYYLNVCKNLLYDKNNPCPAGAAACKIITLNGKRKALNIGETTSPPVMNDDSTITLTYENGESCSSDSSKKWKTVIKFVCEHKKKDQQKPVFKSCDGCVCNFEWKTYEVCAEKEKIDEKKCTVKDENSQITYDLSPLRKAEHSSYKVKSKYPGISYFLNVCGVTSVTDKNCENSGVCRSERINGKTAFISLGLVKYQKLVFDTVTNSLVLKYLQDADGTKPQTSIISFECNELVGQGQPVLITDVKSRSLKFFSFHWLTSVICAPVDVPLVTEFNGHSFNLKDFTDPKRNLFTEDGSYTYKINFFGGIKHDTNGCPKTAAVCRISKKGDEINVLAPVSTQKLSANSTNILIDYTGGKASCTHTKVRAVIKCSHDDEDDKKIILQSFDEAECYYLFVFKSKLLCKYESHSYSQLPIDKRSHTSKKHATAIAIVVILAILILLVAIYILASPERRANTASSVRFNCKRFVCCRGVETPGYKYRKIQAIYGDEDIEEREGLLLEDSNDRTDNTYKDSDTENEDDELLPL